MEVHQTQRELSLLLSKERLLERQRMESQVKSEIGAFQSAVQSAHRKALVDCYGSKKSALPGLPSSPRFAPGLRFHVYSALAYGTGKGGGCEGKKKSVYLKMASHFRLSIQSFRGLAWVGGPARPPPPPWMSTSLSQPPPPPRNTAPNKKAEKKSNRKLLRNAGHPRWVTPPDPESPGPVLHFPHQHPPNFTVMGMILCEAWPASA